MSDALVHLWEPPARPDAPVLLALHGTGGDEHDLLPLARALAPGTGVLAPRGPVVEADGMPRFFRRIPTGDGGAYPFRFDDDEIVERAGQLRLLLAETVHAHGMEDRDRYVVGFSNGASMGAVLLVLAPGLLRGGLLFAPMPVLSNPPVARIDGAVAWLAGGRRDPISTPVHVERVAGLLRERGASVDVHLHDGGHEVSPSAVIAGARWLGDQAPSGRSAGS